MLGNLNCVSARARLQSETQLEAASRQVEKTFNRIQVKEAASETVEEQIAALRLRQVEETQVHLQWLQQRKQRLAQQDQEIDAKLDEMRLLLEERRNQRETRTT